MLGSARDPGIMVRTLRDLYRRIESQRDAGSTIGVSLTYIEIYNENIRDLLVPASGEGRGGHARGTLRRVYAAL